MPFTLPENCKLVNVAHSQAANAVTYDVISCKNAHKVWFIITQSYAGDTDLTLSLIEATSVDGSTTAVTGTFPFWQDVDVASVDLMTRQTDAALVTFDTTANKHQMIVIEWDPAKHTAGYDCIALVDNANAGGAGNASNYVTVVAVIQTRYPGDQPPAAITN